MKERLNIKTRFIDPRWLNNFRMQRVTKESGQIMVGGVALCFAAHSDIVDGTEIEVSISGGYFYAEPSSDVDARYVVQLENLAKKKTKEDVETKRHLVDALDFNQSLLIPVKWTPAIKDVLSGLSEHSSGEGRNTRTVIHALLKETLLRGRLKREKGDFLCTTAGGSNGKNWSDQAREHQDEKVTCKSCLDIAERLRTDLQVSPVAVRPAGIEKSINEVDHTEFIEKEFDADASDEDTEASITL